MTSASPPRPSARELALLALHLLVPAAVGPSLALAFGRPAGIAPSRAGMLALAAGPLFAYAWERLARRRADAVRNPEREDLLTRAPALAWALALVGACGVLAAVAMDPRAVVPKVAVLAALVLAYPLADRVPLLKTPWVGVAWTWGVTGLAFDPTPLAAPATLLRVAVLLVVVANCVLCDLKDEHGDRASGLHTLPGLAGPRAARAIAAAVALVAAFVAWRAGSAPLAGGALALAALSTRPSLLERELSGPLLADACLLLPGLLVLLGT